MSLPDYKRLDFKDILIDHDGPVVTIWINRAKQRNTINTNIIEELIQIFELVDRDDRVRVVILTAEPTAPAFCSGADISGGWDVLWEEEAEKEGPQAHRDGGGRAALAIYRCRKITIAAVNGHAAGAGITALQLPFDIRFVWAGAKLTFPFIRRGIVPEATSSYLLPRLLGHSRANSLLLTGEIVTPDSPHIQGLYHQILPTRDGVYPTAKAFANELAANTSQTSIAFAKGLLQHPGDSIEENHLLDSRAMKILAASKDGAEGVQSFKERRLPKFVGSLSRDLTDWFPWWRRLDVKHLKAKL
ncbi:peroxisomal enoyl-CoA-hydratase [Macrolepiota fuliginosa MF-IS2]|uniref:Peroxisomal enoyl-CoA-hydratase n=1 Tax=Macrolepiota fuliginosa MF-IS2 TaxID=1400762 RepID=A0A9P6C003_9AGAR|nr:peroxisomal enoyl-CoA-hydratase [Macrolepiota fuliginosa MF-IS2]